MNIPEFSVRNPILAWMMTIVVVVGGLFVSLMTLPKEVFPVTDLDLVLIRTVYPNASPEEVEDLITNVIEDELRDVEDIEEYTSNSAEGISVVVAQIDPDAEDTFRVVNDIQRMVDQIDDLPEDAEDPVVESITTDDPVIRVCVSGTADEYALREYGDSLERELERIPGVSTITKLGWRDEEFWVEADSGALVANEISLEQLIQSLARSNINLPGGKVHHDTGEVLIRTVGKFYTTTEISNVVVRSNIDGNHVSVGDVAEVTRRFERDDSYLKANGEFSLELGVKKRRRGDTIEIADAVKELVGREKESLPEGITLLVVDDTSYYVNRRLSVLLNNAWIGLAMVLVCLFVALNPVVAGFTAIGIPFSFMGAILAMSFFGLTINMMTMFGLIIVLGMIVDDSIIVGENIYRHMELGTEGHRAAIEGATEVQGPVTATVLTTIAAFFPLMFAPDIYATVLGWLVMVVILALLASLFECLFILPAHIGDFAGIYQRFQKSRRKRVDGGEPESGERRPRERRPGPIAAIAKAIGGAGMAGYLWSLRVALRWRYVFLPALVIVAVSVFLLVKPAVKVILFPADLIDIVFVDIATPVGTPLAETDRLTSRIDGLIHELPDDELENTISFIGEQLDMSGGGQVRGTHLAQIRVYLTPQSGRERLTATIVDALRAGAAEIEGLDSVAFQMVKPGPPAGKPFETRIEGQDFDTMTAISAELREYLGTLDGVLDIGDDYEQGKRERHVIVDELEASRFGVDVASVARTVFAAYEGVESTIVREGKEEVVVRVMLEEEYRQDLDHIGELRVPNQSGRLIPLGRIASFSDTRGLPTVNHYNGERVVTVGAEINEDVTTSVDVNARVSAHYESNMAARYPGYRLLESGEWKETRKVTTFMVKAVVIAVLAIYTILAVQFGSFFQPIVLLIPVPLGFLGVVLALLLYGKPISIMAMMGMVGLGGVVVNDAIVLVSFVNQLRKKGSPLFEALENAGRIRLRPIVLTSVTTIVGLLPIIHGWGGDEPFVVPAAIVLAYGLLFATYLTLIVVPVVYHIAMDIKLGLMRLLGMRRVTD